MAVSGDAVLAQCAEKRGVGAHCRVAMVIPRYCQVAERILCEVLTVSVCPAGSPSNDCVCAPVRLGEYTCAPT